MAKRVKKHPDGGAAPSDAAAGPGTDLDEVVATLRSSRCDYCLSPIEVTRSNDAWAESTDEISFMLNRAGKKYDDIVFAWYCTECDNFSIVGTDFEEQWLDSADDPMQCEACSAVALHTIDPAQGALKDRPTYLALKKEYGADALLNGGATYCQQCETVEFFPHEDA